MIDQTAVIDMQLWTAQEQLLYGLSWLSLILVIYYLFRLSK